ncbi:GAF domain-containing protein [Roseivirga sp. BDSF3-8]|uniref:GAF domain-containing protein n=1 Tax=Roseivirga sp. BDSF3-8 TaxID=3241598 RepID=UPI0035325020
MAETLILPESKEKKEVYETIIPQIEALISGETDYVANMANVAAALREAFGFFWVGFYSVKNGELVLGPFQGPIACTRIRKGKGVCGTSWDKAETIVVEDVDAFPGHIACSSASRSEIVVPGFNQQGEVAFILDIDSDELGSFDEADKEGLEKLMRRVEKLLQ